MSGMTSSEVMKSLYIYRVIMTKVLCLYNKIGPKLIGFKCLNQVVVSPILILTSQLQTKLGGHWPGLSLGFSKIP